MKVLIILAHSNLENGSIANKTIINELKKIEGVEIRNLYQMYPDFKIDVEAEQQALIDSEVVIFQYPFHWYNIPGILKEWVDKVFLYGFAYGSSGDKLTGKELLISTTVGGPEDTYKEGGHNNFTISELLKPLEQTAKFTGMNFNKPLVTHDMAYIPDEHHKKIEIEIEHRAREHAAMLLEFIAKKVNPSKTDDKPDIRKSLSKRLHTT